MQWVLAVATLAACHHARPQPLIVQVETAYPGASSETVAGAVTTPLERALAQLPHVTALTSVTVIGASHIRVAFQGDDVLAAHQAVQDAINRTTSLLPRELPTPPVYGTAGPLVGRYLVPRTDAETAMLRVSQVPEVGLVELCGSHAGDQEVVADLDRLAAAGLTLTDVRAALQTGTTGELSELVITYRAGAPVRIRDVATIGASTVAPACQVVASVPDVVELAIEAQAVDAVPQAHAGIADALRKAQIHAIELPSQREVHVELAPEVDVAHATAAVRSADLDGAFVAEVRGGNVLVVSSSVRVIDTLRRIPGVVAVGEPTAVVHVSGADPKAVADTARAISARLQRVGTLVTTHGLAIAPTTTVEVDRDQATRLGIATYEIDSTLAVQSGVIATTIFTQTGQQHVYLRAASGHGPLVHGSGDTLIPLAQVVTTREALAPVEILHRGQFPDVDLEVAGDPHDAIGSVPAGVLVEID